VVLQTFGFCSSTTPDPKTKTKIKNLFFFKPEGEIRKKTKKKHTCV
jgi:hypothetical protein